MANKSSKERRHLAGYEDGIKGKWFSIFLPINEDIVEGQRQGYEDHLRNKDLAERMAAKTEEKSSAVGVTERVVERIVIREVVGPVSSSGGECSCPAHKIRIDYARVQRVTGIEWLRKIISRLNAVRPKWDINCFCNRKIYGTFTKEGVIYTVFFIFDCDSIKDWLKTADSHKRCFDDLVIAEGDRVIIDYSPGKAPYLTDTPEKSLGRSFTISLVKFIWRVIEETNKEFYEKEAQAKKQREEKERRERDTGIARFFRG